MRKLLVVLALAAAGVLAWLAFRKPSPPEVAFAKVARQRLESTLVTNGKVEPLEWLDVRAESAGLVERMLIDKGRDVPQGAILAELQVTEARAELAAAEARIEQARAEMETVQQGGRASDIAEIDSALARARQDREAARSEAAALERLAAKKAATSYEAAEAKRRVERAELEIAGLEAKRKALVGASDRTVAQARLRDAQAAADAARRRIASATVRSPMTGTVYNLQVRKGAYVNPGDLLAQVGKLERVRVTVYVDEPELGRVQAGMPVNITWDALPGRKWTGVVERVPTQIVALGTRQVGEVVAVIDNPGRELLPGTNINAEIRSRVVENALSIPREALRREGDKSGVYVLNGRRVEWRPVQTGVNTLTRIEVVSGLKEGDEVALPTDAPLKNGVEVRATATSPT